MHGPSPSPRSRVRPGVRALMACRILVDSFRIIDVAGPTVGSMTGTRSLAFTCITMRPFRTTRVFALAMQRRSVGVGSTVTVTLICRAKI